MDLDDKTREKIRALLAKADSTEHAAEAATFAAKAAALMARHGLDRDDLDADVAGVIATVDAAELWGQMPYGDVRVVGLRNLGQVLGVYVIARAHPGSNYPRVVDLLGRRDAVDRLVDIWYLIQAQADAAVLDARPPQDWRFDTCTDDVYSWDPVRRMSAQWGQQLRAMYREPTPAEVKTHRRSMLIGYLNECAMRLGEALASPDDDESSSDLLPVLASDYDKAAQMFDDVLEAAGMTRDDVQANTLEIDPAAKAAGHKAARQADVGIDAVGDHREQTALQEGASHV